MRPVTPRGFRDVLLQEAAEREVVTAQVAAVFDAWGYAPVETPMIEEYATLEQGVGLASELAAFRLFDLDGSLLALRPEMTVPIARVAASRLADQVGPQRVRYTGPVFRENVSLRGQARQFTQAGIELIGEGGPAADAEVVALAVEALTAAGLDDFVISIGTVALLSALLEGTGQDQAWEGAIVAAVHDRNLVELDRLAGAHGLDPPLARALAQAPRLRGGAEAFDACEALIAAAGAEGVLAPLRETYRILDALGYAGRVTVDFGIMRSFDYYTGFVFEAYAPGVGAPLGGGGRYDRLLAAFGRPAPAAGFALGLERVMIALAEQGSTPALQPLDALIGGDAGAAFAAAHDLRASGWRVRMAVGRSGAEIVLAAELADAHEALVAQDGEIWRLDRAGERALPLARPLPAPPSATWAGGAR
jgi:ATP phosphoribosyltransferase regulatory subunit